ncbi:MAG: lytic transglycosylase domain-containing protein [Alphaproteobacteria bacterium]|nr:lytic transglycosylase domain-containing protein [Alphaproteobacteria bacterium]
MAPRPPRRIWPAVALVAAGLAVAGTAQAAAICDEAGAQAEAAFQIPTGLLRAIGRVESGRRDPATGAFAPWPFTINANGQGRFFDDAASATAAVRSLQAAGTSSIDVGCFQVNLMHHPLAFVRLEDGFDPATNAAYAATFLAALRQRLGNWEGAVAAYHSATPERGEAYRARVFAAWNPAGAPLGAVQAAALPAAPRRVTPLVIRISGPDLSGPQAPIRVWSPSRPGTGAALIAMPAPVAAALAAPIDSATP